MFGTIFQLVKIASKLKRISALSHIIMAESSKNIEQQNENTSPPKRLDPVTPKLQAQVLKITDRVYVAIGFAVANVVMIEGTDGIILVDTTENEKCVLTILEEFRKITKKPVKGIVLTHFHGDHIDGLPAVLETAENGGKDIKIYAHATLAKERDEYLGASDCGRIGIFRQFGVDLKKMASALNIQGMIPRLIDPTDTFEEELKVSLAGVDFTLFHAPGETRDQINVWIPGDKVVIPADNIAKSFPNLAAIRGAPPRDPEAWYQSLDKIRRLRPTYLVPCHLMPVVGEQQIYDIVTAFRDGIQYVNDQTIRCLNDGYEVDDIIQKIRLPPVLASHPYLQELYGTVEWSVRGIIQRYCGWFDRHPVNLYPLTKQERAVRLNELLNKNFDGSPTGVEKMLIVAEEGLKSVDKERSSSDRSLRSDLQWSLEMLSHVLKAAESDSSVHKQAMEQAIACLKLLAGMAGCPSAKRYYLTCASELPNNFIKKLVLKGRPLKIHQWPADYAMNRMRYSFRSEACKDDEEMTVVFSFADVGKVYCYTMRHRILEYQINPDQFPSQQDVKVSCNSQVWKDVLTQRKNIATAQKEEELTVGGKVELFERFVDLLDMCPDMHPDLKPELKTVM